MEITDNIKSTYAETSFNPCNYVDISFQFFTMK